MHVSVADAENQLSQLIRAVEEGEEVIITRSGKPVVQTTRARQEQRTVELGALRGRITLKPSWDAPMTEEEFLVVALAEELAILSAEGGFRAYAGEGLVVIG